MVVSVASPALAASPVPGLSGLMRLTYRSRTGGSAMELTTDDDGLGLRVENSVTQPVNAFLAVSLDSRVVQSSADWGTNAGWTVTSQGTSGGFSVWRLAFTGSWTRVGDTWTAATYTYTIPAVGFLSDVKARVQRSVQIAGQTFTRDSGVIIIGANNRSSRRAPAESAPASDGGGEQPEIVLRATA